MRAWLAPLMLAAARGRRRPARWLLPALGMALAAAFVVGVAAQAQIAGDQSARSVLAGVSPLDSQVRVTWQGPVSPSVTDQARGLLRGLGLGSPTEVLLMNPVRLAGVVVRPAAISSLGRWLPGAWPGRLGPCRPESCPMLLVGGGPPPEVPSALTAIGVRIQVAGSSPLRSAVPLGFAPSSASAGPVLVTWDVAGLDALPGLSGLYRTHSWLAPLTITGLRWWQLAGVEDRLQASQARLLLSGSQFSLSAPFAALDQARAEASVAPQRLLLAGGGAIAALALFIVLAGGGLRRDQRAELDRLRNAGARTRQCVLFVAVESGWLCAAALIVGAVVGIGAAALLASSQGEPAGAILMHAVITRAGVITLVAGWLAATVLLGTLVLVRTARLTDLLAVAAASALVAALAAGSGSDQALALLLAPLCCAAAGVLTFRAARLVLLGAERVARHGPVLPRLALLNLARSPGVTALAIAFIAVATGLGGFALAYRSTLVRSAADQAADQVPLDVLVSPGPDFRTPLEVAPLRRWQALASGAVLPVRRTDANYTTGGGTVTVPALGIPAGGLTAIHGWRESDGSASLATLARRLEPIGPVRAAGPTLPADAQWLSLRASAQGFPVEVTADLRDPQG
ncbi:MAG TPA: ABC transporter permease, partial [Streptosporangiaceae bacterium]|nr:ABC transporter permease [Streptosporangiaceae bacterium]